MDNGPSWSMVSEIRTWLGRPAQGCEGGQQLAAPSWALRSLPGLVQPWSLLESLLMIRQRPRPHPP